MTDHQTDARQYSPAVARNREPILTVLRRALPRTGVVLEIASGSGEHAVHFARALPSLLWQPSDPDPEARASIAAWRAVEGVTNLLSPLDLDAARLPWPLARAEAVVCCNMIHIAPWEASEGLLAGAGAVLASGSILLLYGPFRRGGAHTAPSNAAFDASLRARDPARGVRDLEQVERSAATAGLALRDIIGMPANNLCVIFERQATITPC